MRRTRRPKHPSFKAKHRQPKQITLDEATDRFAAFRAMELPEARAAALATMYSDKTIKAIRF